MYVSAFFTPLLLLYTLSAFDAPSCIITIITPLDLLLFSKKFVQSSSKFPFKLPEC